MIKTKVLFLALLALFITPLCASTPPLNQNQITQVFSGNTFTGQFSDSHKKYAVYFEPSGKVYLQKQGEPDFVYYGKWTTQNNLLVTPWPYQDLQVKQAHKMNFYKSRDLIIYKLQFYALGSNVYEPYKPRLCGCDPSKPRSFPHCSKHEGRYNLQQVQQSQ